MANVSAFAIVGPDGMFQEGSVAYTEAVAWALFTPEGKIADTRL